MLATLLGLNPATEQRSSTTHLFTTSTYRDEWSVYGYGSAEEALTISTCWQAVSLLSGDLAKLPILKMVRDEQPSEGGEPPRFNTFRERPQPSHPTWPIVHERPGGPGSQMSAHKFWQRFWVQLLLWSNAYCQIFRDGEGRPTGLGLLESAMVSHSTGLYEDSGYWYIDPRIGQWDFIPATEVLHVEDLHLHKVSSLRGQIRNKPIWALTQAQKQIGIDLAIEQYQDLFFQKGGRAGGILEIPMTVPKQAADDVVDGFKQAKENLQAMHDTIVLRDSMSFKPLFNIEPDKTQLVEARKQAIIDWSNRFKIPPHKLGDASRTAYNSLEQENKSYLDSSLAPRLHALMDELKTKLLMPFERQGNRHFYKADTSQLTEADLETRTNTASTLYTNNIITKNEARNMVGQNHVDGGDVFLQPMNMVSEQERDAVRLPLLDSLRRSLESMNSHAERKRKRLAADDFEKWIETDLPQDNYNKWSEQTEVAINAFCQAAGLDPEQLRHLLYAGCCHEIKGRLRDNSALRAGNRALCILDRIENDG